MGHHLDLLFSYVLAVLYGNYVSIVLYWIVAISGHRMLMFYDIMECMEKRWHLFSYSEKAKKQQQFVSHNKMKSYCTFPQNGNAHFTLGIFVKTHDFLYKMVCHILKLVFFKTYQNSSLSSYSDKFTFFSSFFPKQGGNRLHAIPCKHWRMSEIILDRANSKRRGKYRNSPETLWCM